MFQVHENLNTGYTSIRGYRYIWGMLSLIQLKIRYGEYEKFNIKEKYVRIKNKSFIFLFAVSPQPPVGNRATTVKSPVAKMCRKATL